MTTSEFDSLRPPEPAGRRRGGRRRRAAGGPPSDGSREMPMVPDVDIDAEAHDLAMSLAQGPSVTLGYIKRNINNAETMTLEACFDAEAIHHSRSGDTADHKEAAKAFVEKRKPAFQGQ